MDADEFARRAERVREEIAATLTPEEVETAMQPYRTFEAMMRDNEVEDPRRHLIATLRALLPVAPGGTDTIGLLAAFALGAVVGGLVVLVLLCALIAASDRDERADRGDYRPGGGWR